MASSCEELVRCQICRGTLTQPVSTACGHNYCRTCITESWSSADELHCSTRMHTFGPQPEVKGNAAFQKMAEHFGNMMVRDDEETPARAGEVPCDLCSEPKLKAQRSCLMCLASYCRAHLEQHLRVPTFKKHRLISPVANLEDNICKEHDEALVLFCTTEQVCVCFTCSRDNHAKHEVITLERAYRERKDHLVAVATETNKVEMFYCRSIKDLKCSAEQSRKKWEGEAVEIDRALNSLVVYLQRSQAELMELMQASQKIAQKSTRHLVTCFEEEIAACQETRSEIEDVLQRGDPVHLLQKSASLSSEPHMQQVQNQAGLNTYLDLVNKAVARMQATLSEEVGKLNDQVLLMWPQPDEAAIRGKRNKEMKNLGLNLLSTIQLHPVDVILDPRSANPRLLVSEDGKFLYRLSEEHERPCDLSGDCFSPLPFVLGKDGFSSGFSYQVQISGAKSCVVGVVKESINRKSFSFLQPEGWLLFKSNDGSQDRYYDCSMASPLNLQQNPTTVGVFVDYEKGEVSFHDADTGSLLHSYKECDFSVASTALKDALFHMAGFASRKTNSNLYPVFGVYTDGGSLVIPPVDSASG